MSVTKYMRFGVYSTAPAPAPQQQSQDSSPATGTHDDSKIVSLDPRYSDDEQKEMALVFENRIEDLFESSRFADVRALIDPIIESFPGIWRPIQEREDCVIQAFWDEREFLAYQRAHPDQAKPVLWGLPSLSKLFCIQAASYSRELLFRSARVCLLNAWEYEPDHPRIAMAKGNLLNWENRFEEALEAYRGAATVRSWTAPSVVAKCLHGQGVALGALHRLPEARDAFAQALELDPEYEEAKRDLGRVLYDLQQFRKLEASAPAATRVM